MAIDINSIVKAAKEKVATSSSTSTNTNTTATTTPRTMDIRTVDAESLKTKAGSGVVNC